MRSFLEQKRKWLKTRWKSFMAAFSFCERDSNCPCFAPFETTRDASGFPGRRVVTVSKESEVPGRMEVYSIINLFIIKQKKALIELSEPFTLYLYIAYTFTASLLIVLLLSGPTDTIVIGTCR